MRGDDGIETRLKQELNSLRDQDSLVVPESDIDHVSESVITCLQSGVRVADLRLYEELAALAEFIQKARADVAELRPQEIQEHFIPSATDELDAVVGATESATHTIMDNAEKIETQCENMPDAVAEIVSNAVTEVFMACGFQDITGQRITKVVKALKHIEIKVGALLSAFDDHMPDKMDGPPEKITIMVAPSPSEELAEDNLLNGPQHPNEAIKQSDIDKFFN